MLAFVARRAVRRSRERGVKATSARSVLRHHPGDDDQPGADGVLEEPVQERQLGEQTRPNCAGGVRGPTHHAGPHKARAARRRDVAQLAHVPPRVRTRGHPVLERFRVHVRARDVRRLRHTHHRRALEREHVHETAGRVEESKSASVKVK